MFLINRATQGGYPGSSFKIVTLAAALTHNPDIEQKIYDTPGYVKVDGRVIKDHEGVKPGNYDLLNAFRVSSNSVFIKIGLDVGWNNMVSTAENFGFNNSMKAICQLQLQISPTISFWSRCGTCRGFHRARKDISYAASDGKSCGGSGK